MTGDPGPAGARAVVPKGAALDLARRLIKARSENPPGHTSAACDIVAEEMRSVGMAVDLVEPEDGFSNVIATWDFPRPGRTLVLNGHVDVVPARDDGSWTQDPWAANVHDGRLYGRGSVDMKGPFASLLVAAREIVRYRLPLAGRLVVTAVADEEQGGERGTGALARLGLLDGDAALIAEPGEQAIGIAHRGMCFVELTTRGKATHASIPANGVNAVDAMVDALASLRDLRLRHRPHEVLGEAGVAVGTTIQGGTRVNVIPDACRATLDVRTVPGMTRSSVLEDIRGHLARHGALDVEIELLVWGEAGETSADEEIVRVASDAFAEEFGFAPPTRGMRGATDGWRFTEQLGIPAVMGFGPGRVRECHSVDESVDVVELERYARVYASTIARYLEGQDP